MNKRGALFALGAGIAWGASLGIFARVMSSLGFSSMQISAVRTTISALAFIVLAAVKERSAFRIDIKDGWIFLCSGCISVALFCYFYFTATANCSLAVAGILQYTAPIWVVLLSAMVFREKITRIKALAMLVAVGGCVLVSGITGGIGSISAKGLMAGILSGITYATYTVFTRFAVPKYSTMTINVYTFIVASATSLLLGGPVETVKMVLRPEALPAAVVGGIMCAALPYFLYTKAMETLDNGHASILATIEPVIAAMVSVFIFKEHMSLAALLGIAMILAAIIVIALQKDEKTAREAEDAPQTAGE